MTRLVFIDTETTSLRPDRRAWEIGLIVRDPGKDDTEHRWFVDTSDLDLGNADPASLRIGRFYDRHPGMGCEHDPWDSTCCYEEFVLSQVEQLTRGAHPVGAVPNFDAEVLGTRMRAHGICPSWHYHLIDVETLAVGYIAGATTLDVGRLPWDSDWLHQQLGLAPVPEDARHTALGDARWARDVYDAVMNGGERP